MSDKWRSVLKNFDPELLAVEPQPITRDELFDQALRGSVTLTYGQARFLVENLSSDTIEPVDTGPSSEFWSHEAANNRGVNVHIMRDRRRRKAI